MIGIRASTILTLGLLAVYHALRAIASQCTGLACDWFIPVSLLLPLLVLILAAVTGLLAIAAARRQRGQVPWVGLLIAATAVGVLGPVVSLAVFRDSPDAFVLVSTGLIAVVPLTALLYSFLGEFQPPA